MKQTPVAGVLLRHVPFKIPVNEGQYNDELDDEYRCDRSS